MLAPGGAAAPSGQFDQSTLELGNNVLVYTTEPLAQPLSIFGTPRVSLYCATSAAHADFTAKLVRVRPSGAAEFICIGIARSSWLFAKTGYAADEVHHWEFDLEPTSCRFAAGERIRLEIASSAFPLYDRNPGTAVPSCRATSWDWQRSTQIVHHDTAHPSALHLPVREAARMTPESDGSADRVRRRHQELRHGPARAAVRGSENPQGRIRQHHRPLGLRQIHGAEVDFRADAAQRGTIRVDGMTPENARETISFIFQDATLLPWRTVTQNVGLGLELERVAAQAPQGTGRLAAPAGWSWTRSPRPIRASFPAA